MYEIVLDTETTGLDPNDGHRLIEIGCIELHNHVPTGRTYHQYLNPEREVPAEAIAVHGLNDAFLQDKPVMSQVADAFMAFIGNTKLVIHNAEFDLKFLNAELKMLGYKPLGNAVVDTVLMARAKFPGQPANLDALCRRFKIDLSERSLHGALLDAQLLAEVYLELMGGRQQGLGLMESTGRTKVSGAALTLNRQSRAPRIFASTPDEITAHQKLIASLGDQAVWKKYEYRRST